MQKINAKRKIKNRKVEKKRKKRGKVRKKKKKECTVDYCCNPQ